MLTEIATFGWFGDSSGLLAISTYGWFDEGVVDVEKGIFVGMDGIFDEGVWF